MLGISASSEPQVSLRDGTCIRIPAGSSKARVRTARGKWVPVRISPDLAAKTRCLWARPCPFDSGPGEFTFLSGNPPPPHTQWVLVTVSQHLLQSGDVTVYPDSLTVYKLSKSICQKAAPPPFISCLWVPLCPVLSSILSSNTGLRGVCRRRQEIS